MKIEERFFKVPFCVSKIKVALNVVIEPSCVLTQLLLLNIEEKWENRRFLIKRGEAPI